jgi:CBS domain-containing protein
MLQTIQLSLDSLLILEIMSRNVKTVVEGRDMRAGCRVMSDNDIGSVVIVNKQDKEKIPIGSVTERDIVRTLGRQAWNLKEPLTTFMSKPIITVRSDSTAREAMQLMNSNDIRRIVVVDTTDRMIGILTEKDIFRELLKKSGLLDDFTKYG